jgi:type III pantothenate kinase
MTDSWIGLMIGNSRLHWSWFYTAMLQQTWDTPHLSSEQIADLITQQLDFATSAVLPAELPLAQVPKALPLWLSSVIPAQIPLWLTYPQTQVISLEQIPFSGLYPTFGIYRALALLGAATRYGLPSLVIDAGTALTFTGANAAKQLVGGAILPGLQLQLRALAEHTAALPQLNVPPPLPLHRWSTNTTEAIWSGVLYGLLAGIQDFITAWRQEFRDGSIVLTGGDAMLLLHLLQQQADSTGQRAAGLLVDPALIFWGMQQIVAAEPA